MEVLHTAEFESPIGTLRCASTALGLAHLELPRASGRGFAGWLRRHASGARVEHAWAPNREAIAQILDYLEGKRRRFDLPLDLRATPFQKRVYEALVRIPFGETRSYGEVARAVGAPRAVRAVGSANGANPIPLVVPCHRVVASGNRLGGFGGGLRLKRWLLAHERVRPLEGDLL
jgi:O-6-methylguanine DNA methyltransferase